MKARLISLLIITSIFYSAHGQERSRIIYPTTEKAEFVENIHGIPVSDPYRWMEEMQSAKVKDWVQEQDALLKKELHSMPLYSKVKDRITELNAYTRYTVPIKIGQKYFYTETPRHKSKPILYVQEGLSGEPKILVEPNKSLLDSDTQLFGGAGGGANSIFPSPDGKLLAYSASNGLSRWYSLHILDLTKMKDNPVEVINGLHCLGGSMVWSINGGGFYYVKFELPDKNADLLKTGAKNGAVYFHQVRTSPSTDQLIYKQAGNGSWNYSIKVSNGGKYLIIETRDGSKSENHILYQKLDSKKSRIVSLLDSKNAQYSFFGNSDEDFYFFTNQDAPNGKIVGINSNKKQFFDIIQESAEAISGASLTGGNALGFFDNKFIITYIKDGKSYFKGFDRAGKFLFTTKLPIGGTIWGNFHGADSDKEIFFNYLNLTDASTIYKMDVGTGALTLFKTSNTNFDSEKYITEQVFYKSSDGTKIPMFVTHRKDIKLDGTNPAFIYGYGALNWVSILFYQEHLLVWLEMGGIYAQPSIRGGGEYGENWHKAGIG
jgi:prolyl oligopeptidase